MFFPRPLCFRRLPALDADLDVLDSAVMDAKAAQIEHAFSAEGNNQVKHVGVFVLLDVRERRLRRRLGMRMVDSLEFLAVVAHGAQGINKSPGVHLEQPLFVARDIRHRIAARKTFCVAGNQPADFLVQCLLRLMQNLVDDGAREGDRVHAPPQK